MSRALPALALLLGLGLTAGPARAEQAPAPLAGEDLDLLATLPLQDGGRIKPLDTYASFTLLRLRGARACYTPEPERRKLGPVEWLAHCLFHPEVARGYDVFLVSDSAALEAIGIRSDDKRKRDRWSYAQLEPGLPRLRELAGQLAAKDPRELSVQEEQLLRLAENVNELERLLHFLDFARSPLKADDGFALRTLFKDRAAVPFSEVLAKAQGLLQIHQILLSADADPERRDAERRSLDRLVLETEAMGKRAAGLALLPGFPGSEEWLSPAAVMMASFEQAPDRVARSLELLVDLEALARLAGDPAAFSARLRAFHGKVSADAEARGEYAKVPLEVRFYRLDPFYKALLLFLPAFLLMAVTWMAGPGSKLDRMAFRGATALSVGGLGFVVLGIAIRCVLRSRPPVSTLYETILFITGCAVLTALAAEWLTRQRIGAALAPSLGAAGMFLAMRYEAHDGRDTMPTLVAVLDTNFWLSTHVTTVTLGYAAGLLAGVIGHIYLVARIVGAKRADPAWLRGVARLIYGVLCFGLLFSVVGTILGGVWANDSWGRFWGWDPKENGALMIVLWELAILHARMGGYIGHFGLAVSATAGTIVVAFSWWGVNLLGVGLHSYGFTSGVKRVLTGYYVLELLFLAAVGAWWLARGRAAAAPRSGAAGPSPAEPAPAPPAA